MFEGIDFDLIKRLPNRVIWLGGAALVAYVIWWYHGQYEKNHAQPVPKPSVETIVRLLMALRA